VNTLSIVVQAWSRSWLKFQDRLVVWSSYRSAAKAFNFHCRAEN